MSASHKLDLFDKLTEPILSYGCEVWATHDADILEKIHIRFCKHVLGVRLQTQNNFVYGELGRYPLTIKRLVKMMKYII